MCFSYVTQFACCERTTGWVPCGSKDEHGDFSCDDVNVLEAHRIVDFQCSHHGPLSEEEVKERLRGIPYGKFVQVGSVADKKAEPPVSGFEKLMQKTKSLKRKFK